MSMQARAYLGAYLWVPSDNPPDCYPRLTAAGEEGANCVTLIPNVSYPGGRSSFECRSYELSEIEIGPLDRDTERALFGRTFEAEIDVVMKAEPDTEIRWGLLLWHM